MPMPEKPNPVYVFDSGISRDMHTEKQLEAYGQACYAAGKADALPLERGADVRADDDYAVRGAAENGHLDTVRYLVERGADWRK